MRRWWTGPATVTGVVLVLLTATATPVEAAETDVSVTMAVSTGSATTGDVVTAVATVVNTGPDVGGLEVQLTVTGTSWSTSLVSASVPGGHCEPGWGSCSVPSVAAGQTVAVTATYRLGEPGSVTFTASAFLAEDSDSNPDNDRASASVAVQPLLPVLGLTASAAEVGFGREVRLTATMTGRGVPATMGVRLYRRTAADAAPVLVAEDWGTGSVTFADTPREQAEYVARSVADSTFAEAASPAVVVRVTATVTTVVSPVAIPPGGSVSVTVRVQPAVPGGTVVVEERYGSGGWRTVATPLTDAAGKVTVALGRRTRVGTYAVRVTRPPDQRVAAGTGQATTVVTVTGAGRGSAWRPLGGSKARPSHWGTCSIGYRVNPRGMPPSGMADLREAMRRVTQVSGVRFRSLGRTALVPWAGDMRAGPGRITVAWATTAQTRGLLLPGIAGVGGTSHRGGRILTGYLAMNRAFSDTAAPGFGKGVPHGLVLMHELGHVLGLDHSADRRQVMNPGSAQPASVWGAGDLRGLRAMGRAGGCR